jgi:membrane protein YdbS with pleckstrin-like domain
MNVALNFKPQTSNLKPLLTQHDKDFMRYWEVQRTRKKSFLRKLSIGLPLAVVITISILVNMLSGWYSKADMVVRSNSSLIIVVLIAGVGIVVFITIFSARHRWEQNEQRYQELLNEEQQMDPEHLNKTDN